MSNPWLGIPLDDYEVHMALPHVGQTRLLADAFERALTRYNPRSVAVIGCAGGNGFERIRTGTTKRVVGVDINPEYIERLRVRFKDSIPGLELITGDIQSDDIVFQPVDLVFAGLLFEHVDFKTALTKISRMLDRGGMLISVVQLPAPASAAVTPSPFASVQKLAGFMRLVPPELLADTAAALGCRQIESRTEESRAGKRFQVQSFLKETP